MPRPQKRLVNSSFRAEVGNSLKWHQAQDEVAPVSTGLICARKALLVFNAQNFSLVLGHL